MKGGQQTPVNIPRLNCRFICLEKVKTKKTYLLTRNSSSCEIILLAYVILKHFIEGKIEGRMEVKGSRGIRCKHLLDDLKKKKRSHFKEEALNRTLWRTRFVRSYGPVIRQIRKMTECLTPILTQITPIVKPTRCTSLSNLLILEWHSTCFRGSFRSSSGAQDSTYSNKQILLSAC